MTCKEVFNLVKKNLIMSLIFFTIFTIWKWFTESQVDWIENIWITIMVVVGNAFVDWGVSSNNNSKKEKQGN